MRGKFVTLEGVDGAGKSTHQKFVADLLAAKGKHVIQTREPGGTDLAERLRQAILADSMPPLVETLLIFAARADHVSRVIKPSLDAGTWVVCDRFTDATAAYQGAGKGVAADLIHKGVEDTESGFPDPEGVPAYGFCFGQGQWQGAFYKISYFLFFAWFSFQACE